MAVIIIPPQRREITKDGIVYKEVFPSDCVNHQHDLGIVIIGFSLWFILFFYIVHKSFDSWPEWSPAIFISLSILLSGIFLYFS